MNSKQLADKFSTKKRLMFSVQRFFRNVPGLGSCGLCGRTWNICKSHETPISELQGCFPLCEDCWLVLSPKERLPYYEDLVNSWKQENDRIKRFVEPDGHYEAIWDSLKENVLAGL